MFNSKTKAVLVWLSCIYCFYYLQGALKQDWHFIDNVDLIIHEAGHLIFMPFGEFLTVAGGSLLQVILPIIFFIYFHKEKQYFSQAVMLLWVAINLFNVGVYASDALKMQLPLLGGENSGHDWNYLLLQTRLINQTKLVSDLIFFSGIVNVLFAAYLAFTHMNDSP